MPFVRSKIAASLDGRTALDNGKSQWITSEAARQDVQHWRAQASAIITGVGTVLMDNPTMNVRLHGATRQPLRVIVDSQLRTPVDCNMLRSVEQSPVLIVYAADADKRHAELSATGAQLLCLPNASGQVDLLAMLKHLAQLDMNEILLEAGQGLNGAFLNAHLIDELILYYAAKLMGASAKGMFAMPPFMEMQQAIDLQVLDIRQLGQDIRVRAKPVK